MRENRSRRLRLHALDACPFGTIQSLEDPPGEIADASRVSRKPTQASPRSGEHDRDCANDGSLQRTALGLRESASGHEYGVHLTVCGVLLGISDVIDELYRSEQLIERKIDPPDQARPPEQSRNGSRGPPQQRRLASQSTHEDRTEIRRPVRFELPTIALSLLMNQLTIVGPERVASVEQTTEPPLSLEQQWQQVGPRGLVARVHRAISQHTPSEDVRLDGLERSPLLRRQTPAAAIFGPSRKKQTRQCCAGAGIACEPCFEATDRGKCRDARVDRSQSAAKIIDDGWSGESDGERLAAAFALTRPLLAA